ncbi:MAG: 50S ribosomal protein L23 [Candidatus Wildermuthbacteria bacterium]|nr:50S ribosomal protein L23 [Candidatus Wildermuthbacteria bacterium]
MSFQIFKKSQQNKETRAQAKEIPQEKKEAAVSLPLKTNRARTADVLKSPHVTERAALLSDAHNQYVFKVFSKSNKTEIKKAVEDAYGVRVSKVNVIRVPAKTIRVGRHVGTKKGYKKAIVFLKKGDKIEIISR